MLRGIVICPDDELHNRLKEALAEVGLVSVTRRIDRYPNSVELVRLLRAHAPQVIFLSIGSLMRALEIAREVEKSTPGIQVMAISDACDPHILLELMRAGVREFAAMPFDRYVLSSALNRMADVVEARPPEHDATDQVFSFLPSKGGVGTSTVALNTAMALSRMPDSGVLLSDLDLNCGMIRFMVKLDNHYCITDACEHSFEMDESLWPQMVSKVEALDILHAGKLNPDFRIEGTQIRHLMEFMRRNYRCLCFDLSGNLERYSLEVMHESKRIFLVCTPEIPSLHLAREKYLYLRQLELGDRVSVLLNRCQKRPLISPEQIEQLLGLPVHMTFPNDYNGVHRALTFGRWVDPATDLGKQFTVLAQSMMQDRATRPQVESKKRFIEYFSLLPGKTAERKTAV